MIEEEKKQSYLTKADRFLIEKYQIDGIGIGVCIAVLLMNFIDGGSWGVFAFGVIVLAMIVFGTIKKTNQFDTFVEPEGDNT